MATTQRINQTYYVRFRFQGVQYRKSLEHGDESRAENTRKRVEVTLLDIQTGLPPPPPPDADVPRHLLSGGKLAAATTPSSRPARRSRANAGPPPCRPSRRPGQS